MPIYKNVASQKLAVYAYDGTTAAGSDASKTGDAANITARISKDGGASAATNDVNPTELDSTNHKGIYIFDLTQAETNANMIVVTPDSSTSNILLDPITIYTVDALAASDINAELLDVLNTDTYPELESADVSSGTATPLQMLREIHALARNPVEEDSSNDTQTVFQRDGATELMTATVTVSGTVTTRSLVDPAP